MRQCPDPDSVEMGHWVDRWLVSLRAAGLTPDHLERLARGLGRAAARNWVAADPFEAEAVQRWQAWLNRIE